MTVLTPEQAFRHVAEHYNWLGAAACSWDDWPTFAKTDLDELDRLLPNVNVALQASALIYARGLIEFYDIRSTYTPTRPDIKALEHYGIDLSADSTYTRLVDEVKPSIDQHLCHISEFRDPRMHVNQRSPIGRVVWGTELPVIADDLLDLLNLASANPANRAPGPVSTAVRGRVTTTQEPPLPMATRSLTAHAVVGREVRRFTTTRCTRNAGQGCHTMARYSLAWPP